MPLFKRAPLKTGYGFFIRIGLECLLLNQFAFGQIQIHATIISYPQFQFVVGIIEIENQSLGFDPTLLAGRFRHFEAAACQPLPLVGKGIPGE